MTICLGRYTSKNPYEWCCVPHSYASTRNLGVAPLMLWTPLILRRYPTIVCFWPSWFSSLALMLWHQLQLVASRCSSHKKLPTFASTTRRSNQLDSSSLVKTRDSQSSISQPKPGLCTQGFQSGVQLADITRLGEQIGWPCIPLRIVNLKDLAVAYVTASKPPTKSRWPTTSGTIQISEADPMSNFFFLLNMLWSRHVKPSSAKGEKRLKRIKTPKFVQTEHFRSQHYVQVWGSLYNHEKTNYSCRKTPRYAKTYQKPSLQSSVHHVQQEKLRQEIASGSTIADIEAA